MKELNPPPIYFSTVHSKAVRLLQFFVCASGVDVVFIYFTLLPLLVPRALLYDGGISWVSSHISGAYKNSK